MVEKSVSRIRLIEQDVIKRELSPLYVCGTIFLGQDSSFTQTVYNPALDQILSGERKTREYYIYDGMPIAQSYLTRSETVTTLAYVGRVFRHNRISFSSCYLDSLRSDGINLGVYLEDKQQLRSLRKILGDRLRISFMADLQADGEYVMRDDGSRAIGHLTSELHLKGD